MVLETRNENGKTSWNKHRRKRSSVNTWEYHINYLWHPRNCTQSTTSEHYVTWIHPVAWCYYVDHSVRFTEKEFSKYCIKFINEVMLFLKFKVSDASYEALTEASSRSPYAVTRTQGNAHSSRQPLAVHSSAEVSHLKWFRQVVPASSPYSKDSSTKLLTWR